MRIGSGMAAKTLVELVAWLEELFDRHKIERSYGGAIARNYYAVPRLTRDVDVLVFVSQLGVPPLVRDLVAGGALSLDLDEATGVDVARPLELARVLEDLRRCARVARLLCFGIRVEVFAAWLPFDHEVLRRAQLRSLDGRKIRVHSPEDLIVYKKVFNRSKDIEDIKAILVAQAQRLDLGRIRDAARLLLDAAGAEELEQLIRDFHG